MSDSLRFYGLQTARLLCPWGFSRQEYWRGLPCPPAGHLPNPGTEPTSLTPPALVCGFFTTNTTQEAPICWQNCIYFVNFLSVGMYKGVEVIDFNSSKVLLDIYSPTYYILTLQTDLTLCIRLNVCLFVHLIFFLNQE